MLPQCPCEQSKPESQCMNIDSNTTGLTILELAEVALYTVQKINNYPKSLGKTVENYFHLLFPDEVKAYLIGRTINHMYKKQIRCGCW